MKKGEDYWCEKGGMVRGGKKVGRIKGGIMGKGRKREKT